MPLGTQMPDAFGPGAVGLPTAGGYSAGGNLGAQACSQQMMGMGGALEASARGEMLMDKRAGGQHLAMDAASLNASYIFVPGRGVERTENPPAPYGADGVLPGHRLAHNRGAHGGWCSVKASGAVGNYTYTSTHPDDMVDNLLAKYLASHPTALRFTRLSPGLYLWGSKRLEIKVAESNLGYAKLKVKEAGEVAWEGLFKYVSREAEDETLLMLCAHPPNSGIAYLPGAWPPCFYNTPPEEAPHVMETLDYGARWDPSKGVAADPLLEVSDDENAKEGGDLDHFFEQAKKEVEQEHQQDRLAEQQRQAQIYQEMLRQQEMQREYMAQSALLVPCSQWVCPVTPVTPASGLWTMAPKLAPLADPRRPWG